MVQKLPSRLTSIMAQRLSNLQNPAKLMASQTFPCNLKFFITICTCIPSKHVKNIKNQLSKKNYIKNKIFLISNFHKTYLHGFSIPHKAVGAVGGFVQEFADIGHTAGHTKTLSKGTGGHINKIQTWGRVTQYKIHSY